MNTNKHISLLLSIFCLTLTGCIGSCTEHDQQGFPKNLYFGREGGTQIVHGTSLDDISIRSFDDDVESITTCVDDTLVVTADWLTVRYVRFVPTMEIKAQPLTDKKKRSLYIEFGTPDLSHGDIKVTQR